MSQSQFSLSWNSHAKNLNSGLSTFQQNGDFVDMTLAADGHFVKVHQVIIALSSPYIKELLSSAPCPHPVLFLNNISYTTLCTILEYIYTGEVHVSCEHLLALKIAAKELHIKGLEDINVPQSLSINNVEQTESENCHQDNMESNDTNMVVLDDNICYFEITDPRAGEEKEAYNILPETQQRLKRHDDGLHENLQNSYSYHIEHDNVADNSMEDTDFNSIKTESNELTNESKVTPLQYTVSNQGSLQIILNRYVYYLKHSNRNNTQQWRCVDYLTNYKCPAHVLTKDGIVAVRVSAHTHPFHDKRILKKLRAGAVYTAIGEAQEQGQNIRNNKNTETYNDNSE